ncbi:DinB family protein [Aquimarina sp. RZ0]|uniref:DinB family protein n=1 Tax=Aquimarina sp. RZ0 TaxID=2607730 RepID=UPI0011F19E4D|nr:DinB family protein [Aquimarina sp. RZ0]KAA1243727.1 DinB family protein [Aquimarina sp. RZ0]
MTRSKYIANKLREVLLNGHWIANTNYKEQIENLTWQQAAYKIKDLNTIALLTYHVDYYIAGLIEVCKGGSLEIRDKYSFDLSPIRSETDWRNLVEKFLSNAEEFASIVENMEDQKLDDVFVDTKYGTYLRNIEGILEHSYYHLGQISLIRKLIVKDKV